ARIQYRVQFPRPRRASLRVALRRTQASPLSSFASGSVQPFELATSELELPDSLAFHSRKTFLGLLHRVEPALVCAVRLVLRLLQRVHGAECDCVAVLVVERPRVAALGVV